MRLDVCPNPVSLEVTMVRRGVFILALSLLLVTVIGLAMPATAVGGDSMIGRVVVVVTPPLSWLDVTSGEMPATRALADLVRHRAAGGPRGRHCRSALAKRFVTALPEALRSSSRPAGVRRLTSPWHVRSRRGGHRPARCRLGGIRPGRALTASRVRDDSRGRVLERSADERLDASQGTCHRRRRDRFGASKWSSRSRISRHG